MHTANSIPLMKVASSKIAAIGHDAATNTLAVQFLSKGQPGNVYHYSEFSSADYDAFSGAESIGKHFIAHIQPAKDKYPYVNMGVPSAAQVAATPALTKELLAVALHGREYPFLLPPEEQALATAAGLVVIYGNSDDSFEARGAIIGQQYVYGHGAILIDGKGLLPVRDNIDDDAELRDFFTREPLAKKVRAIFGGVAPEPSWTYTTSLPHATFDIMEDGIVYCRGIVISMADLGGAA
ncbi:KTSC domain-containing protein [Duganella sp. FT50W]|uniref:KTSC domain-containing protein n=1 Tax=Duganella lactea TaxID=2692173 RepID=A0A6L8MF60_9BURK|nr:KTSC domain-containing protein [Duganella lactea]MYM81134.1 KTSC domain-containing protein [Duganella lactea]